MLVMRLMRLGVAGALLHIMAGMGARTIAPPNRVSPRNAQVQRGALLCRAPFGHAACSTPCRAAARMWWERMRWSLLSCCPG